MGKDRKRRGPKSTRAGCLLCKPHKHQGVKGTKGALTVQERRARVSEKEQSAEVNAYLRGES